MGKSAVFFVLGLAAVGIGGWGVWWSLTRGGGGSGDPDRPVAGQAAGPEPIKVLYPFDGALFPPEIAAAEFRWEDSRSDTRCWRITFDFRDGQPAASFMCTRPAWTPMDDDWEQIKQRSRQRQTAVRIRGYADEGAESVLSAADLEISTSQDEVGAPLFFREVNLPFLTAVKDPAAHIRWRFGEISSKQPPPIVLEKLPVCGNCHSFSADGSTLALEVDSGNDKGAYAIAGVEEQIVLDPQKIITWSDYRREDNEKTFGLLCQASPDGRYVVGTVKDRALAVYRPELAFSQLFFLVKGILAVYDRQTETFQALPGADDPNYVQTNATWSPDGKSIVFARSRDPAYDPPSLRNYNSVLVPQREADEFLKGERTFPYDLYRIPFNEGRGGKAEPIEGASNNGMSNYFAKFSPDGKWIVFCQAKSFMLLQPDSQLFIIPAAGGPARRLRCNLSRMNSWHSWSPNSRWLVFSSKEFSDFTQLFLTHIDEQGESTPPVVLANFTAPKRAANIPEFANVKPGAIKQICEQFLDDTNYLRVGDAFRFQGEYENAIRWYRRALDINPENAAAQANWGACLLEIGKIDEAETHLARAIELQPDLAEAHCSLGLARRRQNRPADAVESYRQAIQIKPDYGLARLHLGTLLLDLGQLDEAKSHLAEAVRLDARDPYAHFNLAVAYGRAGQTQEAAEHFSRTLERDPNFVPALISLALLRATSPEASLRDGSQAFELATRACELTRQQNPEALYALSSAYAETGRLPEAAAVAESAIPIAQATGNASLMAAIRESLQRYRAASDR